MAWSAYRLELTLHGPLHIGWRVLGNVQFTRPYVPARNLWGAVTARLTRQLSSLIAQDYLRTGDEVKRWLAFTYFYPLDEGQALYPVYNEGAVAYGSESDQMSAEEFAWRFLASYASTALNYPESSAHAGSLHEVEYLAPWPRTETGKPAQQPLQLLGYIFVNGACPADWWGRAQAALKEFRLGGEGRYGFGHVTGQLHPLLVGEKLFGLYDTDLSGARPVILLTIEAILLAHTRLKAGIQVLAGELEPLVGRDWDSQHGAGQKLITLATACLVPGSRVSGLQQVEITPDGLWKVT